VDKNRIKCDAKNYKSKKQEKTILIDLKKILKKVFKRRNFYVIIEYVNLKNWMNSR
jgi:uncharacterized protein YqfB (UPF0267 family)